jgi:hypothetical protein
LYLLMVVSVFLQVTSQANNYKSPEGDVHNNIKQNSESFHYVENLNLMA